MCRRPPNSHPTSKNSLCPPPPSNPSSFSIRFLHCDLSNTCKREKAKRWRVKATSPLKSSRGGSKEQWVVSGMGISSSGSSHGSCTARVQPLDKPLGLQKEGVQVTPEEPPRAIGLVMCFPPFNSPNPLFLENRNCLWKNSLGKQSKRVRKEPGGQMGKNPNKSSGRTQTSSEPRCFLVSQNWTERGEWSWDPFFLGFGLWFLFIPYWRHQMSPELRDLCPW